MAFPAIPASYTGYHNTIDLPCFQRVTETRIIGFIVLIGEIHLSCFMAIYTPAH